MSEINVKHKEIKRDARPTQALSVILSIAGVQPTPSEIFPLLARLDEYRLVGFELQTKILTEAQEKAFLLYAKNLY